MITVKCPHCQAGIRGEDRFAGRVVACPKCKKQVQMPTAPELIVEASPGVQSPRSAPTLPQRPVSQSDAQAVMNKPGASDSRGGMSRQMKITLIALAAVAVIVAAIFIPLVCGGMLLWGLREVPPQPAPNAVHRAACIYDFKQIGLAMHEYHKSKSRLPPAYTTDKDGKPLLSWRVHILPYIEEGSLYDLFRRNEPWNSEHNKKLIAEIPEAYRNKGPKSKLLVGEGKTTYLAVRGERTVFPGNKGIAFGEITDGLKNTIMVVEVADDRAVLWTKPDDFEYDEQNPLKGLVGSQENDFLAGFADGSVRFVPSSISPTMLKALFTRDGKEIVDWNTIETQKP